MKKGTPEAPGRCSVVSRLAACSNDTEKRERSTSRSQRARCAAARKAWYGIIRACAA